MPAQCLKAISQGCNGDIHDMIGDSGGQILTKHKFQFIYDCLIIGHINTTKAASYDYLK